MADSSSSPAKKTGGAQRSRQAAKTGESSTAKLLKVLLLVICCAGAGYFFWNNLQIIDSNENAVSLARMPQPPDPAMETEKQEIAAAEEGLQNMTKSSSQAMQVALLAEVQNRYPLDLPASLVTTSSTVIELAPIEPDPPMVTVVAIMITDTDRVAMVNVDGENGILMRQGTRFSEGKARITKIDEKGVTFSWMRKNYQVSL